MARYLTRRDVKEIERAQTFEELQKIALRILKRMPQPVGMVCGPISSGGKKSVRKNIDALCREIAGLRKRGKRIFNQTVFESPFFKIKTTPYFKGDLHLLEAFYLPLFKSGRIKTLYFLRNWKSSDGARWEHEQALRLGMEIVYL